MRILDTSAGRWVRRSPALRVPAIAAYRTVDRLRPARPGPRVIANSMPKSGTHLLATLLDQLEGMRFAGQLVAFDDADRHDAVKSLKHLDRRLRLLRDSHYIGGHLMRDPRVEERVAASGVKLVTIMRDPRAVVVSGAHYVMDAPQIRGRREALELFPDFPSVLRALVMGHGEPGDPMYFPEIGARYAAYADWTSSSAGLTVRFEDLIGTRGGGSDEEQLRQVSAITEFLGYELGDASAGMASRLFSEKVVTFRAGTIDSWRADLPGYLAHEIEERCALSMKNLGYVA